MSWFNVVVPAGTCVVRYRQGAVLAVLEAGVHPRRWRSRDVSVDLRRFWLQLALQEIPTNDGVPVRVSAAAMLSVSDPVAYLERAEDPRASVYLAVQVALRQSLAQVSAEQLMARQLSVPTDEIRSSAEVSAQEVGLSVHRVVIKDLLLPAEVRAAGLELATARQRSAAQLEAARAETAALRALANAAKLLDDHPALARLKLLQAAPSGSKIVMSLDGASSADRE